MKKFLEYSVALYCLLNASVVFASEKFEMLPDLPDSLTFGGQAADAATVSGNASIAGNVGHEPSIISVVFSLLFVVLLIYLTGILYAKLNKVGFQTLKKQQGDLAKSQVAVVSTTALGNNKTLHVVELDGKRMLIGASSGAIQLIKDLGVVSENSDEAEYSRIEIPNIKIPKIEIPRIEIPTVNFSKLMTKIHKDIKQECETGSLGDEVDEVAMEEIPVEQEERNPEEVIDSLFKKEPEKDIIEDSEKTISEHIVDPEEFALYKKYLG